MTSAAGTVSAYKLASVLLQYPSAGLVSDPDRLRTASEGVPSRAGRAAFGRFLSWLAETPPGAVAQHYVETFDLRRRCTLYLTYPRYGDTRKRGMSMLTFKTAYRAAGFVPAEDELPDYLPMVLEFADLCPAGERLLSSHRLDLELLRRGLDRADTPYADVVAAVCEHLPGLGRRELALVARAWESGPPREEVGLEPFAPPEYLSGYGAGAGRGEATR